MSIVNANWLQQVFDDRNWPGLTKQSPATWHRYVPDISVVLFETKETAEINKQQLLLHYYF